MSEDKPTKPNGLVPDPKLRLTSLKAPRDLMLGAKPNKKVFLPNLNITRNKTKGTITATVNDQKKDGSNHRNKKNNKNFKKKSEIIKSSGVFSEGMGTSEKIITRCSYASRETNSTPALKKPTIRVKDVIRIDKELEEQKIRSVMGTDDDGMDEEVDFKNVLERDAPIKLPMDDGSWIKNQPAPKVRVKQEVIVKTEPGEDGDGVQIQSENKPSPDIKEVFENTDVYNLLKSEQPTLIMLQLPDELPGRGGGSEDDAPRRKNANQPSTSSETTEPKPETKCRLADLEEGKIGKLRLHRSGKVTLVIGDTLFEVSMGTKPSFHQEVVSVSADDASRSAALIALGALHHKLNVLPHWETLFQNLL